MTAGDQTEIGERGITLSGGQKARLSLARAIYQQRDIVLMDDPISALDADVRKKVFSEVFMDLLANKTRVLVTHSIDFLQFADKVVILKRGEIKAQGTFNELQNDKYLREILSIHSDQIQTFQQTSKLSDEPKCELEKIAEGPDKKD